MIELIERIEKGELHVHLMGLASTDLLRRLLQIEQLKGNIPGEFNLYNDLNVQSKVRQLSEYLRPWQILKHVPTSKESLGLIVRSAFQNLQTQNITFVELRNSVIYLAHLNGISVSKALGWLVDEVGCASSEYGIVAGLILTTPRGEDACQNFELLLDAYVKNGKPEIVVGLDLAGDENLEVPPDLPRMFAKARGDHGLGVTIHAGESGQLENVFRAVLEYKCDRIGHGTAASRSRSAMDLLREKDICVEVCPISNELTGAVREGEPHPILELIKNEVPFVLCSDNPSVQHSCLSDDYLDFYRVTNRMDIIRSLYDRQKEYSFINEN